MIEAQDIGDGEILTRTTMRKGPNNTRQFVYSGSDGHKMVSEWVAEDRIKDALRTWTETVRAQIVQRAEDTRREKIAKARAAAAAAQTAQTPVVVVPKPPAAADPRAYARHALEQAKQEVDRTREAYEHATTKYREAVTQAEGWAEVVRSLEAAFPSTPPAEESKAEPQASEDYMAKSESPIGR